MRMNSALIKMHYAICLEGLQRFLFCCTHNKSIGSKVYFVLIVQYWYTPTIPKRLITLQGSPSALQLKGGSNLFFDHCVNTASAIVILSVIQRESCCTFRLIQRKHCKVQLPCIYHATTKGSFILSCNCIAVLIYRLLSAASQRSFTTFQN